VIAVPTAPLEQCAWFKREVDEMVCAISPADFRAVGEWYEDFSQTSDNEVRELLALNAAHLRDRAAAG
jgi:predicted phosphoribosyltransferase